MKTTTVVISLLALTVMGTQAQVTSPPTAAVPAPTPYVITAQDGNSRVWQRTVYEKTFSGQMVPRKRGYVELGTGLNHLVNGRFVESREEIDILPNGTAAATNGPHQAFFPSDIYNGVIELVTPDGLRLKSRPIILCFDDGTNVVTIAELTNSTGYVAGANQVIYPDAFVGAGFKAGLRYTYTKAGFEQDIILESRPPAPADLNLNPGTTRIQVWTEFFNPPPPVVTSATGPAGADGLSDEQLGFGVMQMGRGKAYLLGTNSPAVRVGKQWVQLTSRQFLVESVPTASVAAELESLPLQSSRESSTPATLMARHLVLPPQRMAQTVPAAKPMQLAGAEMPAQGLVLDYVTLNNSFTNYTFLADTTYYISGMVGLYSGTNTIAGGAVLKFPGSGLRGDTGLNFANAIGTGGNLISTAGPFHPVVFTSKDDNSVGATISDSTGSPAIGVTSYLVFYLKPNGPASVLNYLRFAYAGTGITYWSEGTTATNVPALNHCQFLNCGTAVGLGDYDNLNILNQGLYNVLFSHCGTAVMNLEAPYYGSGIRLIGQNLTVD